MYYEEKWASTSPGSGLPPTIVPANGQQIIIDSILVDCPGTEMRFTVNSKTTPIFGPMYIKQATMFRNLGIKGGIGETISVTVTPGTYILIKYFIRG